MILVLQKQFSSKRPNPVGFTEDEDEEEMSVFSMDDKQGKMEESWEFWVFSFQMTLGVW